MHLHLHLVHALKLALSPNCLRTQMHVQASLRQSEIGCTAHTMKTFYAVPDLHQRFSRHGMPLSLGDDTRGRVRMCWRAGAGCLETRNTQDSGVLGGTQSY